MPTPKKKPAAQIEMAKKAAAAKQAANPARRFSAAVINSTTKKHRKPPLFDSANRNSDRGGRDDPDDDARLLSKVEVLDRVGVTYPTIWTWMREGRFPRSREVGGKTFWIASEIDAWIKALPTVQLKGDAVQEHQA